MENSGDDPSGISAVRACSPPVLALRGAVTLMGMLLLAIGTLLQAGGCVSLTDRIVYEGHQTRRDSDGDGIPDHQDRCPSQAEDRDGLGDEDGCPEKDFDGDGIPDDKDKCPTIPEVYNGKFDEDGCPP